MSTMYRKLFRNTNVFRRQLVQRNLYSMPRETARQWNRQSFQGQLKLVIPPPKNPVGYTNKELISHLGQDNFKEYRHTSRGNTCGMNDKYETLHYPQDVKGFLDNVLVKYYTLFQKSKT